MQSHSKPEDPRELLYLRISLYKTVKYCKLSLCCCQMMHKILSWDLLQWLESLPIASHCLRKIAIFVDLIRRRSVWSLRTVLSQCRVNVSLEKLHKHMWFKYYTQRGVHESLPEVASLPSASGTQQRPIYTRQILCRVLHSAKSAR